MARRSTPPGKAGPPRAESLHTRAAHAGGDSTAIGSDGTRAHVHPIYQTSSFGYPDGAAADRAAASGHLFYTRNGNPTSDALARAVADLEDAPEGLAFASGMAAIASTLFAHAAGGEVLASEGLYGGSVELLRDLGPRHGVTTRFVPAWDTGAVARAIGPKTKALLCETITNPLLRVADLPALGALARRRRIALVVDSTFATPCLVRPMAHGATIVIHSVTKYVGGHGDLMGGVAVGRAEALAPVGRYRLLLGGIIDPFCAFLALRGLRTMPLRVERQCANAAALADRLPDLPGVLRVHYPGRADHPDHERARRLLAAPGAMVSFELANGSAARRFYDRVRIIERAASLGEVASLLTHPASFSHKGLPPEERARLGITDGLLRISVGIEDVGDLEGDVRQALS